MSTTTESGTGYKVGDVVFIAEWERGVFIRKVEEVTGAYGIRLIKLEGHASYFDQTYLQSNQDRWANHALSPPGRVTSTEGSRSYQGSVGQIRGNGFFKSLPDKSKEAAIRATITAARQSVRYQQPAQMRKQQSALTP
jgi:hypothetical protein